MHYLYRVKATRKKRRKERRKGGRKGNFFLRYKRRGWREGREREQGGRDESREGGTREGNGGRDESREGGTRAGRDGPSSLMIQSRPNNKVKLGDAQIINGKHSQFYIYHIFC